MGNNYYILALDHGTSGIKNTIMTHRGELVDYEFSPTRIIYTEDGGVEQDPEEWWQKFLETSEILLDRNPEARKNLVAIAVSSTFSSTVFTDENGKPLINSFTWMDARGAPYVKKIVGNFPTIEGYNIFKMLKWIRFSGGGPTLSGKDDIAHVLLLKEKFPEVYKATRWFLSSKDYFNLRLTGIARATYDSITLFWVTDNRNPHKIEYSPTLIKMLGVDPQKFPPLVKSTDIIGNVKKEIAEELGISPDVRVVAGSPDLQSAAVGSGAVEDYQPHLYVGTSSWLLAHVPFKKTDVFHNMASLPSAIPGKYLYMNEQDMAGGALDFVINNLFLGSRELCEKPAEDPYGVIFKLAANSPPGSRGLLFTPWLNGERSPVDDETLRGGFFNISSSHKHEDFARAVLEGVALNSRWLLIYVEKALRRKMEPIKIIGGGAQSDLWCQIFADVLNRKIQKVKEPRMANARGAVFLASGALGFIKISEIPRLVEIEKEFEPDKKNAKIYEEKFRKFLKAWKNN